MIKEAIDSLDKRMEGKIDRITTELQRLKDEIRSSGQTDHMLHHDMVAFKNDLDAIKGLLLNR